MNLSNILDGKCKEDFHAYVWRYIYTPNNSHKWSVGIFDVPLAMQWGVFEDFAESVGVNALTYKEDGFYWFQLFDFTGELISDHQKFKSKNPARIECITLFNKYWNEKH